MGGGGKGEGRRRWTIFVGLKIDDELRQAIAARAEREQIAPRQHSRLYRALLRAGLEGDTFKTWGRGLDTIQDLHENLARIGGNLNQIAHHANAKGLVKDKELCAALDELRAAVRECDSDIMELRDGIIRRVR